MRKRIVNELEGEISIQLKHLLPRQYAQCRINNKQVNASDMVCLFNFNNQQLPARVTGLGSGWFEIAYQNLREHPASNKVSCSFQLYKGSNVL